MIDRLLQSMLPMVFITVSKAGLEDKRNFARMIDAMATAFIEDDRPRFESLLASYDIPESQKSMAVKALWNDANQG